MSSASSLGWVYVTRAQHDNKTVATVVVAEITDHFYAPASEDVLPAY